MVDNIDNTDNQPVSSTVKKKLHNQSIENWKKQQEIQKKLKSPTVKTNIKTYRDILPEEEQKKFDKLSREDQLKEIEERGLNPTLVPTEFLNAFSKVLDHDNQILETNIPDGKRVNLEQKEK